MGQTCSMHGNMRNETFLLENLKEEIIWELRVKCEYNFKKDLKKQVVRMHNAFKWFL
jgi:hypothetical protein